MNWDLGIWIWLRQSWLKSTQNSIASQGCYLHSTQKMNTFSVKFSSGCSHRLICIKWLGRWTQKAEDGRGFGWKQRADTFGTINTSWHRARPSAHMWLVTGNVNPSLSVYIGSVVTTDTGVMLLIARSPPQNNDEERVSLKHVTFHSPVELWGNWDMGWYLLILRCPVWCCQIKRALHRVYTGCWIVCWTRFFFLKINNAALAFLLCNDIPQHPL